MKVAEVGYTPQDKYLDDSTLSGIGLYMPQSGAAMEEIDWSGQIWPAQLRWEGKLRPQRIRIEPSRSPSWLPEAVASLNSLLALGENWDSYGACTVSEEVALVTLRLLQSVMGEQTPLPSIVPTPSGNIQLEWHKSGIDLEVEFTINGDYSISFEDVRDETESHEDDEFCHSLHRSQMLLNFINLVTRRVRIEENVSK